MIKKSKQATVYSALILILIINTVIIVFTEHLASNSLHKIGIDTRNILTREKISMNNIYDINLFVSSRKKSTPHTIEKEINKKVTENLNSGVLEKKIPKTKVRPKPSCIDSDNGLNYYLKGTATRDGIEKTDSCIDNKRLIEYYCKNDRIKSINYDCSKEGVCKEGACIKCAKEGEFFSRVYKEYPEHCCEGLTKWHSGMDTRISVADQCYETGLLGGSPVGICINCGNSICEDIENPCNCAKDCIGKGKSTYKTVKEFCEKVYSTYCSGPQTFDLQLCQLCRVVDAELTISTLKDVYSVSERVELTDPPEHKKMPNGIREESVSEGQPYRDLLTLQKRKPEFVEGQVIVKFKEGVLKSANQILDKHKVTKIKRVFEKWGSLPDTDNYGLNRVMLLEVDDTSQTVKDLKDDPNVEYAEPNYLAYLSFVPNDEKYSDQWSHKTIQSESAWDIERGANEIVIGLVDTGVFYDHPDLKDNMWNNSDEIPNNGKDDDNNGFVDDYRGYDFVGEEDNNPMDEYGHGTHCAGIAAATTNNKIGVAGMCHNCKIMPVRAGNYYLTSEDIAQAIRYATDNNANIISMSFSGPYPSSLIKDVLDYAYENGVILVAAAGNSYSSGKEYPAAYSNVLSVAATDKDDNKADFSTYGDWVDVAEPGKDILSTCLYSGGEINDASGYTSISGTSMSTPLIAGLAGLLLSHNNSLTNNEINSIIVGTSENFGKYSIAGGRINAHNAFTSRLRGAIKLNKYEFLEVIGDNNGQVDPGEKAALYVEIQNIGGIADNITLKLSKIEESSCVDIEKAQISFSQLSYWEVKNNSNDLFSINVRNSCSKRSLIDLRLEIITGTDEFRKGFTVKLPITLYLNGWPVVAGTTESTHPVIKDINNDGSDDVIVQTDEGLFVFNSDGSFLDGWPIPFSFTWNSPVVGNMDEDEELEIIVSSLGSIIYIFDTDGSQLKKIVLLNDIVCCSGQLSLSDIDNDNEDEILVAVQDYGVFALKRDGTIVPGWPLEVPIKSRNKIHSYYVYPVAGDLNNDGFKEIVFGDEEGNVYVVSHDGRILTEYGWPKNIGTYVIISPAALGDIDGDGALEILIGANINLYAFNFDGSEVQGLWPVDGEIPVIGDLNGDSIPEIVAVEYSRVRIYDNTGHELGQARTDNTMYWDATLADIDDDEDIEIIVRDNSDKIFAFNPDGSSVYGFPIEVVKELKGTYWGSEASVAIADLNKDGKLDLITGPNDVENYVFAYTGIYPTTKTEWPMYGLDEKHSRLYVPKEKPRTKSQIINNDVFDITGYLTMKVEKYNNDNWLDYRIIVDNLEKTILANNRIALDTIWAEYGSFTPTVPEKYRVYAEFTDDDRNVIQTKTGWLNNSWVFIVT